MQADFDEAWQPHDYTEHDGPQFEDDGLQDIDIAADLLRMADAGLSVVANAIRLAECLQVPLAYISDAFTDIKNTPADYHQHYRGDDLELRAANALKQVDELLRRANRSPLPLVAIAELKVLQRLAQDVAMLLCSRFINQQIMRRRRISEELLIRLQAAFTAPSLEHPSLWSRLGNSKFHIFGSGSFGPQRHGRRPRKKMGYSHDDESWTEARNPAASTSAASTSAASPSAASPDFAAGGPTAAASSCEISSTRLLAPPGLSLPSPTQAAEIDIAFELVRVASEGLAVIEAIAEDASFWADLAFVKETFMVLRTTPAYCHSVPRGDDLEKRAAMALLQVNDVLQRRGQASSRTSKRQLRLLHRYAHDLVVLACCRFIPQTIWQNKGIPSDVRERLMIAFGSIPSDLRVRWKGALELEEGSPLFASLTQSKNHVLNSA